MVAQPARLAPGGKTPNFLSMVMPNLPVYVCLLRGVNVGGRAMVGMEALRGVFESVGFEGVRTLLNSGNVVFRSRTADRRRVAGRIEEAIAAAFAAAPATLMRTAAEVGKIIGSNPWAGQDRDPSRLLVMFLAGRPGEAAVEALARAAEGPEEYRLVGEELFLYYPNGVGRSKLSGTLIEKKLGTLGTARTWSTVEKLHALAGRLQAGAET